MGEDIVLAVVLLLAAFSYAFLVRALIAAPGQTATLAEALVDNRKGTLSPILYALAVVVGAAIAAVVLLMQKWFVKGLVDTEK